MDSSIPTQGHYKNKIEQFCDFKNHKNILTRHPKNYTKKKQDSFCSAFDLINHYHLV